MRLAWVAWAVALLAAGSVFAASGDPLVVTGDGVNVRTGPGMENRIMMRLYRDREVVEIAREGEWVRVEIAGFYDLLDLSNHEGRGGGHERIEVAAGHAIGEVAEAICAPSLHERDIGAQRPF